MILLSIGTFLVALSFAGVAICLAIMLNQVSKTLDHTGDTIDDIERHAEKLMTRVEGTLIEADRAMDDIALKISAADPLFHSAEHISDTVKLATDALNVQAKRLAEPAYLNSIDSYIKAIEWSEVASRLYRKWKVADAS